LIDICKSFTAGPVLEPAVLVTRTIGNCSIASLKQTARLITCLVCSRARFSLIFAAAAIYGAFLTRTYYWDGVLFSLYIEGVARGQLPAGILFHPNHLLYSVLGFVLYKAALLCHLSLRAITVLQIFNAITGAITGYLLFCFAKRLTRSYPAALFCWVLFAFGATWWKFSTDADAYIVCILLLLLAVRFAADTPAKLWAVGICHVFAMLFHELAIFAYVPLVMAMVLNGRKLFIPAAYIASTAACVAGAYSIAYLYSDRMTYPALFAWVTSYSAESQVTHSVKQLFVSYLLSYGKLFAGGRLSLIRDYFSVPVCLALIVCVALIVWGVVVLRCAHEGAGTDAEIDVRTKRILWAWLLSFALFLAWWEPGSAFYKLFVWPPIVLLIGSYLAKRDRFRRVYGWVAIAAAIAAWNFGAFIFPHSHASADPVLTLAQTIGKQLPKNATIYYRVLDPDDWYLEYFAPGRIWTRLPPQISSVEQLKHSATGPVCLETTALDELERNEELQERIDPRRRWDLVNRQHNVRVECLKG
jgi:hypothetical protein